MRKANIQSTMLPNVDNYGIYKPIAYNKSMTIFTDDINITNYEKYYSDLLNIFKDGIETEYIQSYKMEIIFPLDIKIKLSLFDYWINLVMWYLIIASGRRIYSRDIFFEEEIKQDTIKDYIDTKLIDVCRKTHTNIQLNNIIDDTLKRFHDIDKFAFYLSNTINLEDTVFMMMEDEEFRECINPDLSKVPIEDVKNIGMQYANRSIDIIKKRSKKILGYDHCLTDAFRASEGINPKQYKESMINIGTKPNGLGSVYPHIINRSFINGGVRNPLDYFIDSSVGRTAQIIKFNNVGSSGHFARLLGLNNMDSELYPDSKYDCHCKNFVTVTIENDKFLKLYNNRYYRLYPDGMEYLLNYKTDKHLIGKTLYVRSPITCASGARGDGICYKCYGDLAYTVFNIYIHFGVNIGRVASEIISSILTQMLLSAKHILESAVQKLIWVEDFNKFFEITYNVIQLQEDIDTKNYKILIDPESIELESEEDEDLSTNDDEKIISIYNEYITDFDIVNEKTKESYHIYNEKSEKLYISKELNSIIRKKAEPIDGKIVITLDELKELPLFIVPIQNNELSRTLNKLQDLLNKNTTIKEMNIPELLKEVLLTSIEGNLKVSAIHFEVILSNQIRDADNILEKADWDIYNPQYQILTLNRALTYNPSVVISLSYQKINKALYNPLTFAKYKPSFMDLFFMKQPQRIIRNIEDEVKEVPKDENGLITPIIFYNDNTMEDNIDDELDDFDPEKGWNPKDIKIEIDEDE